jgi:hypothetical protein
MSEQQQVEVATKILNELLDRRDEIVARSDRLAFDRRNLAYAAHAVGGDKSAQEKLRKVNDESITCNVALESLDAAIAEANERLTAARKLEAEAQDREQATQLRKLAERLTEICGVLDSCFEDFNSASTELKAIIDCVHQLGCSGPTAQSVAVNGKLAFQAALMTTIFYSKELPFLSPSERKTFSALATSWAGMIEQNAQGRLGEDATPDPEPQEAA